MNTDHTVLLVDDAPDMLELLRRNVKAMGLVPYTAANVVDAIDLLDQISPDLVVTDLRMPGIGGLQLVRHLAANRPQLPVLVITGHPDVGEAVEVMKLGAVEYLTKPFTGSELEQAVRKALPTVAAPVAPAPPPAGSDFHGVVGQAAAMLALRKVIERIAGNRATVLLRGESGTGKEMVAQAIHAAGPWHNAPFVAVNCGAIPEDLLESQLFGHVKGAFTGADRDYEGLFRAAEGGTLFLDEVGNASPAVQAKLLRVVQDKQVTPVGRSRPEPVHVRLISASNSDLAAMVQQGSFRTDLYYRLNLIELELPPLRERTTDIPLLFERFAERYARENDRPAPTLAPGTMEHLQAYHWPGNVRELEHLVHRLTLLHDGPLHPEDLPALRRERPVLTEDSALLSLADVEALHIAKVLAHTGQNKTKAAAILGMDRKTLREKLKQSMGRNSPNEA